MFLRRQVSSWRVAKCGSVLTGGIQCFMQNVQGLKITDKDRIVMLKVFELEYCKVSMSGVRWY